MSKATVCYLAALALAIMSTALIMKMPTSTVGKTKATVQSQIEARKQALSEI